jgi:serine protease
MIMKKLHIILSIIFSVFLIFSVTGVSFGDDFIEKNELKTIKGPKWSPDEILVKFKRGVSENSILKANQKHDAAVISKSKRGEFHRLRVPPTKTVEEMVEIYSKNPNVEYAEPNFLAAALFVPSDPYYSYQWNFDNPSTGGINMELAWDVETGSTNVIVAVIDTGVAYENNGRRYKLAPDLAGTSFVPGYDFVNNDTHPNDDEGHGTHVTGTIAQRTDNNSGVAGIAFNVSIMPIKVLNSNGSGSYAGIADGIYFAADNGADVINMSLGGSSSSTTLRNALAYAYNRGVTIVCAAGNEYQSGNPPSYPAAYDAYCIAVGATRFDETRSYYSNTGSYVDIAAPGGDINVDQNFDGYGDGILQQTFGNNPKSFGYYFYQGTSMASPHVAGVAALLISNGVTGPDNVREALQKTAKDKAPSGWDPQFGWGIVDAHAALTYNAVQVHDISVTNISVPASANQGDIVDVIVTVLNEGDYTESVVVLLKDSTDTKTIGSRSLTLGAKQSSNLTFSWNTDTASIGSHILVADAGTVTGETDTSDNVLSNAITIIDPSAQQKIHVSGITMDFSRKGPNYQAIAHVRVVDESNNPVSNVTVAGTWVLNNGGTLNTTSVLTGSAGTADLKSKKLKAKSGDKFTISITGVSKAGYVYDSGSNVETSDLIIVP